MRPTKITYAALKNTGNYENQKLEVEVELNEDETAMEGFNKAKRFVTNMLWGDTNSKQREYHQRIADNPDDYTGAQVKAAQAWLEANPEEDDFPF